MVKKLKKKQKQVNDTLEDPLDEVVVETDFEGNDSPILQSEFSFDSPQKASPINSTSRRLVVLVAL